MNVVPLPGKSVASVALALKQAADDAQATRNSANYATGISDYVVWTNRAAKALGALLIPESLDELIYTPAYGLLHAAGPPVAATALRELEERVQALNVAAADLEAAHQRWAGTEVLVVPDTAFLLNYPCNAEASGGARHSSKGECDLFNGCVDWWAAADVPRGKTIRLVFPIIVVHELDKAKRRGDDRSRARTTLRALAKNAGIPEVVGELAEKTNVQGALELVITLSGYIRGQLEAGDEAIFDQILAIQPIAARDAVLITNDTSMSYLARAAGLSAVMLRPERHDEKAISNWPTSKNSS